MADPKYDRWLTREGLAQITNWAANGLTDEQLAANLGIHVSTIYEWRKKPECHEITEAIKAGREMCLPNVENTFFRKAMGLEVVTETVEEFRGELRDGKPFNGTIVRRTVKKQLAPDTAALIFYLKNKAGYRSEPQDPQPDADAAPTFTYKRGVDDE